MGRDAILGKERSVNLQPTLPGMGKVERVSAPKEKVSKPKKGLGEEIRQGNLPMFMTAPEIIKHYDLNDAGGSSSKTSEGKTTERRAKEKKLMARKLRESKTGAENDSHSPKDPNNSTPTLHESIAKKGYVPDADPEENITISAGDYYGTPGNMSNAKLPKVLDGHHRLAALRNLHPKQFLPIDYF
jgi:hypothetical protein